MEQMREMIIDPVCGEELSPEDAQYTSLFQGETYFFCCLDCQLDFEEAPEDYVGFDA